MEQAANKHGSYQIKGVKISTTFLAQRVSLNPQTVRRLITLGWDEEGIEIYSKLGFRKKRALGAMASGMSQQEALGKLEERGRA